MVQKRQKNFFQKGILVGAVVLVVIAYRLYFLPPTPLNIIFAITSLWIISHSLLAGFFLFQHFRKEWQGEFVLIAFSLMMCLIFFTQSFEYYLLWFLIASSFFIGRFALHYQISKVTTQHWLREHCYFKMRIEFLTTLVALLEVYLFTYFPQEGILWMTLFSISAVKVHYEIFYGKKLYSIIYENTALSYGTPFLSIIIPAYNEAKNILNLIRSLKKQIYTNFEVIVVDDESTDKTKSLVRNEKSSFPIHVLERKGKRGPSAARNFGALHAKGKILLFLDADIEIPENSLSGILQEFIQDEAGIAFLDFKISSKNIIDRITVAIYRFWVRATQFFYPKGTGFAIMVKKVLNDEYKGFDESILLLEDFEYIERISRHGRFRVLTNNPVLASWRRFQYENRFSLTMKYIGMELYRKIFGEIRKPVFDYQFGKYGKGEEDER
ncbi:glycosyltransferase [Candidatus Peregrinibacteria bacterium]|nr:glycosyltransferase [Candidatus Peregrinibacteria bacterium]